MSDSCDLSDEEIQERIARLDALAEGCPHCIELRRQSLDLAIIVARREAAEAEGAPDSSYRR